MTDTIHSQDHSPPVLKSKTEKKNTYELHSLVRTNQKSLLDAENDYLQGIIVI